MVESVPVILPVVFADESPWKIMGLMTSAMTTPTASFTKWLPLDPAIVFFSFGFCQSILVRF